MSIGGTKFFWRDIQKYFFLKKFTLVLLDGFLNGFSKFWFFIAEICILIWDFWVIFKNYSIRMLSICRNSFITHWAYSMRKQFHLTLSIRSASGKMWTVFTCKSMLSIRGTNFITGWAYAEWISSLAEHTWKCLKLIISAESNMIFKNLVLQAPGTIRFRFRQKN